MLEKRSFRKSEISPAASNWPLHCGFFCREKKLIIEIDGAVHMDREQVAYDTVRDEELKARGYTIIRVSTTQVLCDLISVLQYIADVAGHIHPLTLGRTRRGRGEEERPE